MRIDGVYVLGAGGHAKVVLSTLIAQGVPVMCALDDSPAKWGQYIYDVPILGPIEIYLDKIRKAIIAIGANSVRKQMAQRLSNVEWISAIHPQAYVDKTAIIGGGTVVFAGAVVQPDAQIGEHAIINTSASVDHDCQIGSYVHIAPGVRLTGGVHIGEGALIGAGAVVLPELKVGEWSIIGAGAVVTRDIPPYSVAVGVPAKVIRRIEHDENPDGVSRD